MNTGGPAFPTRNTLNDGMTLRDYFAAKAIQGLLASQTTSHLTDEMLSKEAYAVADAMLKAREQ